MFPWLVEAGRTLAAAGLIAGFCLLLLARDPGFFWGDDYQTQTLPGFYEIARAWRAGEVPLLTPASWFGGDLAGEFQYGLFSVFMMAVVVAIFSLGLSMANSAAALGFLHLMVLGAGAFRLGRRYDLTPAFAMLVAVVAALNGWVILWGARNWLPALTSFAWLPWAWWAFERSLDRDRGPARFLLPGGFMYLLLAAGGPSGIVLMGVVTAWIGLRERVARRDLVALWPLVAGWLIGFGLAAPALMALREMVAHSLRSEAVGTWVSVWLVPAPALPGLILPSFPATWQVFGRQVVRPAFELAGAFLPIAVLVARAIGPRSGFFKANAWLLALAAGVLVVSMLPGLASFRWSFKWLPLFHLSLALVAARALSEGSFRVRPAWVACALALVTWGAQELVGGAEAGARSVALLSVLLTAGWGLAEGLAGPRTSLMRWGPVALVLLTLWLPYTRLALWWLYTPSWPVPERVRAPHPLNPAVRYFSLYTYEELFTFPASPELYPVLRPGNASMWAGVEMINGYSAMSIKGITWNFQFDGHGPPRLEAAIHLLQHEAGRDGLLAQMGVDGLIVSNRLWAYVPPALEAEWNLAWDTPVGKVLHRKTKSPRVWSATDARLADSAPTIFGMLFQRPVGAPLPTVLLAAPGESPEGARRYAPVKAELTADRRLEAEVSVEASPEAPGLVVLSRPWYPGYRAWLGGRELPVRVVQNVLIGVEVPAGARGILQVAYRPAAVTVGIPIALVTALLALIIGVWGRPRRRATRGL